MKRWILSLALITLSACGSAELTVYLERDASVQDSIVWYRVIVREFTSQTPDIYPAQRVGDGAVRIPFPVEGKAFTLRVDACTEGDGCDVSRRIAVACSRALTVNEGEVQQPIRLTLLAVPSPDPGGCL
jgi:hypothetical protein